ncbi:G-patch domain-containing protein, partial [Cynara cardunculus var. scolymus]
IIQYGRGPSPIRSLCFYIFFSISGFYKQLKEPCLLPMEKGTASSLFVNDGSFMERFKQLQEEKEKGAKVEESKLGPPLSGPQKPKPVFSNSGSESKASDSRRTNKSSSAGKLAFSLKQKSKLVAPAVKLSEDEEEDESIAGNTSGDGPTKRQKLEQPYVSEQSLKQVYVATPCPSDPTIKKVADKLASFVAKNGRQFEHITRQKNPGDTPFKFLFDESCADYKYYEYRLTEEEKALTYSVDSQTSQPGAGKNNAANSSQRSHHQQSNYQIPASALYEATDNEHMTSSERSGYGESTAPSGSDPIAMMEFYMKKAAQEEKRRQPKHSKDEMPPPASLQGGGKRGHHMGDYIPQEELEKFMANCNDVAAQKAAKEAAERARIQADNVGHRLLSKMGWREGEGLGSSRSGIADPIMAGNVKKDNLGVGASQPGEVTPDDDIYEQYKKRMMLGYRHRPNPLGNPRKAYY